MNDILAYIPPSISALIARSDYTREVNEIRFCICFVSTLFMAVIFDCLVKYVNPFNK